VALKFGASSYIKAGSTTGFLINDSTDTYNYFRIFDATGVAVWYPSGTEAMRLTSTGLGIGTSSPASKLDVSGGGALGLVTVRTTIATGGAAVNLLGSSSGYKNWQISAGNVAVFGALEFTPSTAAGGSTFSTPAMLIDSSGNVGIGTSSPTRKLDVNGDINVASGGVVAWGGTLANYITANTSSNLMAFNVNSAERMRISSDGTFRVKGAGTAGSTDAVQFSGSAPASAMALDSSGNLGLGVTPSAWGSTYKAFQVGLSSSLVGISNDTQTHLTTNARFDGTNWIYIGTSPASRYMQDNNVHKWFNAASGSSGTNVTFTQAMTLDASGNLGIGRTDPSNYAKLAVSGTISPVSPDGATQGIFSAANTGQINIGGYNGSGTNYITFTAGGGTERARIDSSGNLLVGTTSAYGSEAYAGYRAGDAVFQFDRGNDGTLGVFRRGGTTVGSIGVTTVLTTYNTTSDYRLKTVVGVVTGHGARIDALEPIEYTWNSNGSRTRGFLAHKFQEVYAGSVTGEKDAVDENGNPVYQSMQASTAEVIADLVAEIQSLRQRLSAANL
jgi:hypothetical protein